MIALNDVTDVSRAERVLAWGEMARQVAHEIKNPLTPMRLGHAAPAAGLPGPAGRLRPHPGGDRGADAGRDRPARHHRPGVQPLRRAGGRSTSRWTGSTSAVAVGEVVQLYRLAEEGCEVRLDRPSPGRSGAARADEVKEVLVNLLENARNAGATGRAR